MNLLKNTYGRQVGDSFIYQFPCWLCWVGKQDGTTAFGLPTTSFPTCRLQGHSSQVAVWDTHQLSTRGPTVSHPSNLTGEIWGIEYFCIKLGISYISWSPTSKLLKNHEPQITISFFSHVIIYQPRKPLNDSFHQKLSLSLSFGHNPMEYEWKSLER